MPRKRRSSNLELEAFGQRLRERRLAAGLTQMQLAGPRFSHAYVSVLEAGRREPSQEAIAYFANKLQVPVETLWGAKGADWALQLANDLRSEGKVSDGRTLLIETLTNLDRDRQVNRRALMILHHEVGKLEQEQGQREAAASHYTAALELIEDDDDTMAADRAELLVRMGDLRMAQRNKDEALSHHQAASHLLLNLMGRPLSGRT
jgi:transcriptional regulator with XRE-family HTH domain